MSRMFVVVVARCTSVSGFKILRKAQRADLDEQQQDAREHERVADACCQKCLQPGLFGRDLLWIIVLPSIPEADEQIRAQPHELPKDQQHDQVVGENQAEHAGGKERDVGEETAGERIGVARLGRPATLIVCAQRFADSHVAVGIHENQEADEWHHDKHQRGQRIDHEPERLPVGADGQPIAEHAVGILGDAVILEGGKRDRPSQHPGDADAADRHPALSFLDRFAHKMIKTNVKNGSRGTRTVRLKIAGVVDSCIARPSKQGE